MGERSGGGGIHLPGWDRVHRPVAAEPSLHNDLFGPPDRRGAGCFGPPTSSAIGRSLVMLRRLHGPGRLRFVAGSRARFCLSWAASPVGCASRTFRWRSRHEIVGAHRRACVIPIEVEPCCSAIPAIVCYFRRLRSGWFWWIGGLRIRRRWWIYGLRWCPSRHWRISQCENSDNGGTRNCATATRLRTKVVAQFDTTPLLRGEVRDFPLGYSGCSGSHGPLS